MKLAYIATVLSFAFAASGRPMKRTLILLSATVISSATYAGYNANMTGELEGVYVYSYGDAIYFRLKNQPTSHPSCNPIYFVAAQDLSADRRRMVLSRLLTAYATREVVNIGFDNSGDCADGYVRVHRVG